MSALACLFISFLTQRSLSYLLRAHTRIGCAFLKALERICFWIMSHWRRKRENEMGGDNKERANHMIDEIYLNIDRRLEHASFGVSAHYRDRVDKPVSLTS